MIKFLIKIIGAAIARQIERGSTIGGCVGALAGLVIGTIAAGAISATNSLEEYRFAVYLILGIPGCIAGALAGARLGPKRDQANASTRLRLMNVNVAGGLLLVAIFLGVAFYLAISSLREPAKAGDIDPRYMPYLVVGVGFLFAISVIVASRVAWYIDLGEQFVCRRLLSKRVYAARALSKWNFEDNHGEVLKQPMSENSVLHLKFDDDRHYKVRIAGEQWNRIMEILSTVRA